jgi:hypothetical protein
MEATRMYRTVLATAGTLVALGTILQNVAHKSTYSETVRQTPFQVGSWALVVGFLALIFAVWQLHVRLDGRLSWERVSAAAAAIGSGLALGLAYAVAAANPAIATAAPTLLDGDSQPASLAAGWLLGVIGLALGWLLFGIALLRSRAVARGPAIGLVVAAVLCLLPMLPGQILLGAALVWLALRRQPSLVAEPAAMAA